MTYRIVIAEDEPLSRRDLREILEEQGFRVVAEARNGREAVERVAETDPDLVILDLVMPEWDGLEAARRMAAERPCIIITAHDDRLRRDRARDAGVMAWLGKPYREQDIAPAVEFAVAHFVERATLSARVTTLSKQLEGRKMIERAKAALMARDGLSEPDAWRKMQREAMNQNVTLERIAEALIATL